MAGGPVNGARAAAPVRLDFAGGWTDVPPYSSREGGVVVAAAVQLHAHAEVMPREAGYLLVSQDLGEAQVLDAGMCTPEMARLERAMRDAGALGGKAAGSGAGGSMFFLAPDDPREARAAVSRLGMRLMPVRWALMGVRPC